MSFRIPLFLALVLVLAGCGDRAAPDLQPLADSKYVAGEAAKTATGAAADQFAGIAADIGAFTAGQDLPAPSPIALAATTSKGAALYAADAKQREADAIAAADGHWWAALGLTALAGVGLVLRLGKNLPGIAGIAATIAESGWQMLAPDKVKAKEAAQSAALRQSIAYGHAVTEIAASVPALADRIETVKGRVQAFAKQTGAEPVIAAILTETKYAAAIKS